MVNVTMDRLEASPREPSDENRNFSAWISSWERGADDDLRLDVARPIRTENLQISHSVQYIAAINRG